MGMCSDVDIEKVICAANARAHEEQEKLKDGKSRLMWSEGISRPIPPIGRSVHVEIASKIHTAQRQKKNLDGLHDVVAPGSSVRKISLTTKVIKEPNRQEDCVRNSNIAKFGTQNERETELGQNIDRRLKKVEEKKLEQKIINHKNDLL